MNWNRKICKICGSSVIECRLNQSTADMYNVDCPRCGFYQISDSFMECAIDISTHDFLLFSGYLRLNSSRTNPIKITSEYYGLIPDLILPIKNMSVSDKVNNILKYLYGSTTKILGKVDLTGNDISRFYLYAPGDLTTILDYLKDRKLIRYAEKSNTYICHLTIEGWERYEKLKEINIFSKKVFIACKFGTEYQEELVATIKRACSKCGFDANLVSDKRHNDDISHKIISDIKESRFIVADFTDQNNGAYFEAGYAMGMGLEVIKLCRRDHMDDVDPSTGKHKRLHFDTRQYSHIVWEESQWDVLEEDLINQIGATIKTPITNRLR